MISFELMDKIKAFDGMSDEQLKALQPHCEVVEFQKDDKLFTEGDDATRVWFIVEGMVDLRFQMPDHRPTSDEHTISSVEVKEKGDEAKTLGWSCYVPPYKMRLSAYCVTRRCQIVRIKKEDLNKLFKKDPQMGYIFMSYLITVVGYRFHQFQNEVAKAKGENLMSGW